jgi:hypothetical protein
MMNPFSRKLKTFSYQKISDEAIAKKYCLISKCSEKMKCRFGRSQSTTDLWNLLTPCGKNAFIRAFFDIFRIDGK